MRFGFRETLFVLLLLVVPVAAFLFVFQPRNRQIKELEAEIGQKKDKLSDLEAVTRQIPDLDQEILRLTEAIDVIEQKLPEQRRIDEVLKQVTELAAQQHLLTKSIRTEKPLRNNGYSEVQVPVEFVGDFDGFYSFLLELEKLPRIMQLPTMQIEKLKDREAQEGQMKAKITLSVFFEDDDSEYFGASRRGRSRL